MNLIRLNEDALKKLKETGKSWYGTVRHVVRKEEDATILVRTFIHLPNGRGDNWLAVGADINIPIGILLRVIIWMGEVVVLINERTGETILSRYPGEQPFVMKLGRYHNLLECEKPDCCHPEHWLTLSEDARMRYFSLYEGGWLDDDVLASYKYSGFHDGSTDPYGYSWIPEGSLPVAKLESGEVTDADLWG